MKKKNERNTKCQTKKKTEINKNGKNERNEGGEGREEGRNTKMK